MLTGPMFTIAKPIVLKGNDFLYIIALLFVCNWLVLTTVTSY